MKRVISLLMSAILLSALLSGCGDESPVPDGGESTASNGSAGSNVSSEAPKPDSNLNPLTGEYNLKDRAVGKRPVSVVVNNIKQAWPQYGLTSADLCYEMVTEGGITRILAVFADYQSMPKVGSVRSARHQFTDCSIPLDTIFVHIGGSKPGYAALEDRDVTHIDGINYFSAFMRDEQIKKQKGQEHSNFTSGELVAKAIEKKGIKTDGKSDPGFSFSTNGEVKGSDTAINVTVPFSGYATAYFDYDEASGKYLKSEKLGSGSSKQKQIDQNNNQQIAVTNVFVLYADVHKYDDPQFVNTSNWTDIDFSKGGSGYYISGGTKTDFTWSKSNYANPFRFTKADGTELLVNPGNSWVCITSESEKSDTVIK